MGAGKEILLPKVRSFHAGLDPASITLLFMDSGFRRNDSVL
jgi:hypothetical protein